MNTSAVAAAARGTFASALRVRDFRWYMLHHAAAGTAQSLGTVVVAKALFDQTGSKAWIGAAGAGRLVPYLLISGVAGVLADRWDRRRVLVGSALIRSLVVGALAAAVSANAAPLLIVLLVTLATTVGTPCYPALAATIPGTVAAEDLAPANGILSTIETASWVVGPAAGGALLIVTSPTNALLVNAVLFAVGAVCLLPTRSRPTAADEERPDTKRSMRHELREGVQAIVGSAEIALPLLLVVVVNVILGGASVGLVLVAERLVDLGKGGFGVLNAALGIGGFAGIAFTSRLSRARHPLSSLTASAIFGSVPFALLAFIHVPWVAVALMVLAGAGAVVTEVVATTILLRSLPQAVIARVFGIIDTVLVASILVGTLAAPVLVDLAGLRGSLVIVGAVLPTTVIGGAHQWRRLSRRATERRGDVDTLVRLLDRQPWLVDVLPVVLETLAATARVEPVAGGHVVIRQGDEPDDFFVLISGALVVTKAQADGTDIEVNRLHPGDGFGEIGLLGGVARTATVAAAAPSEVLRIRGDQFVAAVNAAPASADASVGAGLVARLARGSGLQS